MPATWLDALFAETADVVVRLDPSGRVRTLNAAAARALGVEAHAVRGTALAAVVGGEPWWPDLERALHAACEQRMPAELEVSYVADGRTRHLHARVLCEEGGARRRGGLLLLARDVTADRTADAALRSSEARLAGILELAHDGIVCIDAHGSIVLFNQGAARIFGYEPHEVIGTPLDRLLPGDVAIHHRQFVRDFVSGPDRARPMGARAEIRGRRRDGSEFPARASISRLDTPEGILLTAIVQDLSEQRRTHDELRWSRVAFDRATANSGIGTWELDLGTGEARWSSEVYALLDVDPATGPDWGPFLETVIAPDRPAVEQQLRDALQGGHPIDAQVRVRRVDGAVRVLHVRGQSLRLAEREPVRLVGTVADVTDAVQADEELRRSRAVLARAQEIAHMGSWDWDIESGALTWSDEVYRIFGLAPQEFAATYDAFLAAVHPDDRDAVRSAVDAAVHHRTPYSLHHRIVRPDGQVRTVHEQGEVTRDVHGRPLHMLGTVHDVTEQQQYVDELSARERFVRAVLDSMSAQTAVLDRTGRVVAVNRAWRRAALANGGDADLGLGQDYLAVAGAASGPAGHGADQALLGIRAVLEGRRDHFDLDYPCPGPDGVRWFTLTVEAVDGADGGAVVSHWEITDRKRAEEALEHQALHDPLTGLPNRMLVGDRIGNALAQLDRRRGCVAVLFCDLDRFKIVNDSLGHAAGDALLVQAAQRLRDAVRPGDTVARFGGDEFVVLCAGLTRAMDASVVAGRVLAAFSYPFVLDGRELHVAPSIGVAVEDEGGADADTLIRNADTAMYRAKEQGGNRYVFFDETLRVRAVRRLEVEHELRRAVDRDELVLHYQPQYDLVSGSVVGAEALLRWMRDDRLVPPGEFVPMAEETGLIVTLGAWAMRDACAQIAAWDANDAVRLPSVSVNVSARQLVEPGLVAMVADTLDRTGVAPERLCLEITETAVMQDADVARTVLTGLRDLGVAIALDDFGTGHASLRYLGEFPVTTLKIDRSFVSGLDRDRTASAIVASVMALAEPLGLQVVAEGVETPRQLELVRATGCRVAQGHLLSRPVTVEALAAIVSLRPAVLTG